MDPDNVATFEQPMTDHWINLEVSMPQGEENKHAKVIGRSKDADGNINGTYDNNPFSNTMVYDVQFPDGEIKEYAANVIAENMYNQVDADGHNSKDLVRIIDYRKDDTAVERSKMHITTKSGNKRIRMTTHGWDLLC